MRRLKTMPRFRCSNPKIRPVGADVRQIAVVRTYNECTTTLAHLLAPLGVSLSQHEILMNLLRSPGLTQQQLAQGCFSAKSGISILVARHVKQDLNQRARRQKISVLGAFP